MIFIKKLLTFFIIGILLLGFLTILPSVSAEGTTLIPTDDTYVSSSYAETTYCSETYLRCGYDPTTYGENIILLKFNISSIPTNAIVLISRLYLYYDSIQVGQFGSNLDIGYILTNWSKDSCPDYSTHPTRDSYVYNTTIIGAVGWHRWDIKPIFEKWLNNEINNYGLWIYKNTSGDVYNFRSTNNPDYCPYISILWYIPYPPNKPTCVSPLNNSSNISITTTLKIHVVDVDNDNMSVSFYWGNDTLIETINDVQNNTDAETSNLSLNYLTEYNWYAVANDSLSENTSDTFSFTTVSTEIPIPPIISTTDIYSYLLTILIVGLAVAIYILTKKKTKRIK